MQPDACSDPNTECTNTDGGYKCYCKDGYEDDREEFKCVGKSQVLSISSVLPFVSCHHSKHGPVFRKNMKFPS